MNRQISDNDEARLFISCAGALKRLEERGDPDKPGCAMAFWEANGEFHLGVRYFGHTKPEDNGYAVFIFDNQQELSEFAASHFHTRPNFGPLEKPDFE
jgi:hypothetical protein